MILVELHFAVLLAIVAFIAGLYGSISGGSSLILLPTLLFIGLSPGIAIGTNRLSVTFGSIFALISFHKKVEFFWKEIIFFLLLATIGAFLGAVFIVSIDEKIALKIVGTIMLVTGLLMLFGKKDKKFFENVNPKIKDLISGIIIFLISFYRGFFGGGAGIFVRSIFINIKHFEPVKAIYYAIFTGFIASIAALGVFTFTQSIDLDYGLIAVAFGSVGAFLGPKIVLSKGSNWTKKFVALIEIISGIYFLIK